MKTAIIGSRSFSDYEFFTRTLKDYDITHVVSGGAKGADTFAEDWAIEKEIPFTIYRPNWTKFGKAAGFIRNKEIIDDCEVVIAFWDGWSKGTANSIDVAKTQNKKVHIILV